MIVSVLSVLLLIAGWWAFREWQLASVQRKYLREFVSGTKREILEDRLLSEGIRFFPESSDLDFVSVGYEIQNSLVCAPREVGLLLRFELAGSRPSGRDVLKTVTAVRQERGCM